ncbi:phage portal protein [Pseudomonas aeruginosa]|uniref:phage portal protein n=1 Tax=Pseudomonas aeruginosa TaxID=287 RepID=UPI003748F45C
MQPLKALGRLFGLGGAPSPATARIEPQVGRRRGFKMASGGRLAKAWSGRTSGTDADQLIFADHETLRQRAREQSINTSYLKRFYRLLRQNVIGPYGIRLQSKAVLQDGKADRITRRLIEKEWRKFCKKGVFDVTGRYSYVTFSWLWLDTLARDGEVLVRLVRNWPNRWGFALQILEADRLDLHLNELLDNGNRIRMGVEIDEWERPVAYWMLRDHPGDILRRAEERYERIPASELIHTFDPWRPHQSRGFTWTHAAAVDIHHLGEFRSATLVKAEHGAKITGFYEQDAEWLDPPDEGEDVAVLEEVEAGTAKVLPYGLTYKPHQNASPGSDYAPFVKDTLRGGAAGLGPSYNRLANDLEGVSYSSLRSGELDERDFYKCCQEFVISELLERVGEEWFNCALLKGAIKIAPRDLARCSEQEWQARGWDWVDPLKDSKAATESISNRTKSRAYYIRLNGDDPDETFEEIEAEEQLLREKGLLADPNKPKAEEPANAEELDSDE